MRTKTVLNFAHRGACTIKPENTMEAFKAAIYAKCDGFELDVQFSKDGKLVVIHDETLDRTTNLKGLVCSYDYKDLLLADAGGGQKIPLFEEVLSLARKNSLLVNVELKTGVILYNGIEEAVIDLIKKYDYDENIIISSFNHYSLFKCKEIAPHIKTGALYMSGLYKPWEYAKTIKADALHPFYFNILNASEDQMKGFLESGLMINPFTVDEESDLRKLIEKGVTGIITNVPDILAKIKLEV